MRRVGKVFDTDPYLHIPWIIWIQAEVTDSLLYNHAHTAATARRRRISTSRMVRRIHTYRVVRKVPTRKDPRPVFNVSRSDSNEPVPRAAIVGRISDFGDSAGLAYIAH